MRNAAQTQPETRDRILAEAERVFRAYGYAKTTVADIAKACGMSPANVYRFYESKAAINEAITAQILKRQEDLALSIAAERRPAAQRLKKLIVEMHRFTCEQYLNESQVHEIVRKAMDEQWSVIDAHIERLRLLYRAVIADGVRAGEFAGRDAEQRGTCVFNAIMPFCHPQLVAEKFAEDHGVQAAMMADFLIEALRARHG
ncbi:MAG TPA: TetR family transcriptional regulator [Nevskia sp.]|nr:TetR family transcriptional regulator [Nevskia sp.]